MSCHHRYGSVEVVWRFIPALTWVTCSPRRPPTRGLTSSRTLSGLQKFGWTLINSTSTTGTLQPKRLDTHKHVNSLLGAMRPTNWSCAVTLCFTLQQHVVLTQTYLIFDLDFSYYVINLSSCQHMSSRCLLHWVWAINVCVCVLCRSTGHHEKIMYLSYTCLKNRVHYLYLGSLIKQ